MLAQSYIAAKSEKTGAAKDRKRCKYRTLENLFIVQPIGYGKLVIWCQGVSDEVENRIKQATRNERAMEFLRQRVSIEVQRGNAASVMATVDNRKEWNNLFLLS